MILDNDIVSNEKKIHSNISFVNMLFMVGLVVILLSYFVTGVFNSSNVQKKSVKYQVGDNKITYSGIDSFNFLYNLYKNSKDSNYEVFKTFDYSLNSNCVTYLRYPFRVFSSSFESFAYVFFGNSNYYKIIKDIDKYNLSSSNLLISSDKYSLLLYPSFIEGSGLSSLDDSSTLFPYFDNYSYVTSDYELYRVNLKSFSNPSFLTYLNFSYCYRGSFYSTYPNSFIDVDYNSDYMFNLNIVNFETLSFSFSDSKLTSSDILYLLLFSPFMNITIHNYIFNDFDYFYYDWSYKLKQLQQLRPLIYTDMFKKDIEKVNENDIDYWLSVAKYYVENTTFITIDLKDNIGQLTVVGGVATALLAHQWNLQNLLLSDEWDFIKVAYTFIPDSNSRTGQTLGIRPEYVNMEYSSSNYQFGDLILPNWLTNIINVVALPVSLLSNIVYDMGVLLNFVVKW